MRVLHYVESDPQAGRVVLATTDGHEQFELSVDDALRSAVTEQPAEAPTNSAQVSAPADAPRITPREIQMRVRAGETPESLAATYDGGLDWMMRFAGPVLAERARIADEARRAKARRSTTEGQIVVFGEAVDERFAAHGIAPDTVRWDSHRREDGQWLILARWVGGQAEREAQWAFQLSGRTVAPMDDTAADLLSDRPIRPVHVPEPEVDDEVADTSPTLSLAPPLDPELADFAGIDDTHTGPLPRAEEVFDQAKFEEKFNPDGDFDEPQLPLNVPVGPRHARPPRDKITKREKVVKQEESDEEKAARASIPSWDDILLGVRRKRD